MQYKYLYSLSVPSVAHLVNKQRVYHYNFLISNSYNCSFFLPFCIIDFALLVFS